METEAEEPCAPVAEAVPTVTSVPEVTSQETMQVNMQVSLDESSIENGTPISQLQKRLALIMPPEAKNKENNV